MHRAVAPREILAVGEGDRSVVDEPVLEGACQRDEGGELAQGSHALAGVAGVGWLEDVALATAVSPGLRLAAR